MRFGMSAEQVRAQLWHTTDTQKHDEEDDLANLRDAMKRGGLRGVSAEDADRPARAGDETPIRARAGNRLLCQARRADRSRQKPSDGLPDRPPGQHVRRSPLTLF